MKHDVKEKHCRYYLLCNCCCLLKDMDEYIIDHTQEETGANNGVTGVVFDYRGFDTLGEATVLFTAVAGVIMIFRRKKQ